MKKQILIYSGLLMIGGIIGFVLSNNNSTQVEHHESVHDHSKTNDNKVWTCSMHPQIRKSEPGQCPICAMDLIPLEADKSIEDPEELRMSPTAMQLANVQTITVRKLKPLKEINLNGKVEINETKITKIPAHFHGRIEKLYVNYTGEKVMHGQLLAEVYSPELATAQQELHLAYLGKNENPNFYQNARAKLENWKISASEIDRMEQSHEAISRFKIHAHHGGVVVKRFVAQGDHVRMGDILFEVADLKSVWIQLEIYERDLSYIKVGDKVTYTLSAFPDKSFEGKVSFIDPVIDEKSRTAKARIIVENKNGQLKPGMFLKAKIKSRLDRNVEEIIIPKTAVIWTGDRSLVYIKTGHLNKDFFKMKEVLLGEDLGDLYVIKSGLEEGEEVVVNGAFNIDAAAQLAGKPSMMNSFNDDDIKFGDVGIIDEVLQYYIKIKDQLIDGDVLDAQHFAKKMKASIHNVKSSNMSAEQKLVWLANYENLLKTTDKILRSTHIKSTRSSFVSLSDAMINLMTVFKSNDYEAVYEQYCPMANKDKGASWLSVDQKIINPYFGKAMLNCGTVNKIFN